jgi:phosphoglycolate/pyridoxal phosphate phosphatase family enzyme
MKKLITALAATRLAIFDLDGVIYRGNSLLPNVNNIIEELKKRSIKVVYNSNNSTSTREMYVARLKQLGIKSTLEDFYTSASITSEEITEIKKNANIYVIGEIGLIEELKAKGHVIFSDVDDYRNVDFVIVGLDRTFTYKKLAYAQKCILQGRAKFYATNTDATLPMDDGLLPGAGVMVNAMELCTKRSPIRVFGKPNPFGIQKILKDFNVLPKNAVIFGDRLNTDIVAGNQAGITTILVLTGVTTQQDVDNLLKNSNRDQDLIPNLVIDSLKDIFIG